MKKKEITFLQLPIVICSAVACGTALASLEWGVAALFAGLSLAYAVTVHKRTL